MLKNDYLCPKCKGLLNVGGHIIFSTKTKKGKVGIVFLNPEIGNYSFVRNPGYDIKDGEQLDFFCPVCHANLESTELSSKLAKVLFVDESGSEFEILFSKIGGEKCTYKIKGDKVIPFGEHQSRYLSILKFRE